MFKINTYYEYTHTDGTVHKLPVIVVETAGGPEEYFNSPFVKSWKFVSEPVKSKNYGRE